ncbi:MAG: CoA-binding protein [Pyrinomonadaceae bacterium]
MNEQTTIERILKECQTIAVVGISSNPMRPSNSVSAYMQEAGYKIIPVNPRESLVLGERAFASLSDLPEKPDLVNVFRRSEDAGAVVDEAIETGAKAVWLQQGIVDEAAGKRAQEAGLLVVMDRCLMVEHHRMPR